MATVIVLPRNGLSTTTTFFVYRSSPHQIPRLSRDLLRVCRVEKIRQDFIEDISGEKGYLKQSDVIKLAEKAGFQLLKKSNINANPKDTRDHPNGVWDLPPSFELKDKDREKYQAIGESDRMTLKFVKPHKM